MKMRELALFISSYFYCHFGRAFLHFGSFFMIATVITITFTSAKIKKLAHIRIDFGEIMQTVGNER